MSNHIATVYQVHSWSSQHGNNVPWHKCLLRPKICKTFQSYWNISVHPFLKLIATRKRSKKSFIKGKEFSLLWTISSETTFKTAVLQFKTNLIKRGYLETLISTTLKEITIEERKSALLHKNKNKTHKSYFLSHNIVHQCLTKSKY